MLQFSLTRRLALAEGDPELAEIARLAQVLKDIFSAVLAYKGRFSSHLNKIPLASIISTPLLQLI